MHDRHQPVLDTSRARHGAASAKVRYRHRNAIQHGVVVVREFRLDRVVHRREEAPWVGGGEVDVVVDGPRVASVALHRDEARAIERRVCPFESTESKRSPVVFFVVRATTAAAASAL